MAQTKVLFGVVVVAALGAGVAGAVLVRRDSGSAGPRTIVVAASAAGAGGDAARSEARSGGAPAIFPYPGFGKPQIEVRGTLPALDSPAQAWRYDKVELTAARVAALGKAFAVTGTPRIENGFWTVGAQQGLILTVRPDGGGVFDLYDQSGSGVASTCASVGGGSTPGGPDGTVISDDGSRSSGPTPPSTTGPPPSTNGLPPATTGPTPPSTTGLPPATTGPPPSTTGLPPATSGPTPPSTIGLPPATSGPTPPSTIGLPPATTVPCEQPPPPAGVPTAATAEQRARSVWAAAGIALGQRTFVVEGGEWLRIVRAPLTIAGIEVGNDELSIGFGGAGAISFAHGVLGTPVKAAVYPRIGTAKAIERWRSGEPTLPGGGWFAYDTSATRIVDAGGTPAPTAGASSGAGATPANPGPDDPVAPPTATGVPNKAPRIDGGPVTIGPDVRPLPPEPINPKLVVTGVKEALYGVTDVDGVEWLLPVYEFQLDGGGSAPVLAIDASWLKAAPVPFPQPYPAPVPGSEPQPGAKPGIEPQPAPAPGTDATVPAPDPKG